MSFLAKVSQARDAIKTHGRVSVRALGQETELDSDELDEIIEKRASA